MIAPRPVSSARSALLRLPRAALGALLLLATSASVRAQSANEAAFGVTERSGPTLIGIFYDLKQSQQRQTVQDFGGRYLAHIDEFVTSGFEEALLNRFFRAALPLYTTQLAIPNMSADVAPRAFGVESVVKPRFWVVHYKAQIAPPADGTYRFVGNFDDVLIVAINRKVVLDGSRPDSRFPRLGWTEPPDRGPKVAANDLSRYGDWIDLKADKPVDIDILIGERPGGHFHGVLLYQKRGETYPMNAKGEIILPLFQLAPKPMDSALFLTNRPPWRAVD